LEYTLRAEQDAAVKMTLEYAETHKGGEFLWNANLVSAKHSRPMIWRAA
jgi:hypothetical protein